MIEILAAVVLGALYVLALWADETAKTDEAARVEVALVEMAEVLPPCLA